MPSANYSNKAFYYVAVVLFTTLFLTLSCRKDFDYTTSPGQLEFSKDTVFLDTVFTNIGSSTYSFKVYNRSNDNITIPYIGLENGQQSGYRLNVDGLAGKEFNNVPLLAKDSMFVFIETTLDIDAFGQNEFLYTDAVQFDSSGDSQKVDLVTLVRDAIFLYPQEVDGVTESLLLGIDEEGNEIRIEGFFLEDSELTFTNEKPYVIYGYAAVAEGKTLTMAPGARVHFHENSGILVTAGASLEALGSISEDQEVKENAIIFEGDRLEPDFEDEPGQWGTIWFAEGSIENELNNVVIKNATIGILAEGGANVATPILTLQNATIVNSSITNLWGVNTNIAGENVVLGSAGQISLYCNLGGRYNFKHTTIANYWTKEPRNTPSLLIDNYIESNTGQVVSNDLVEANFANCIIDGNRNVELILQQDNSAAFNFNFLNSIIQFQDTSGAFEGNPLFNFENPLFYEQVFLNSDTGFKDVQKNDFSLNENSNAIDQGNLNIGQMVPLDILGVDRTLAPDIGAFEFVPQS